MKWTKMLTGLGIAASLFYISSCNETAKKEEKPATDSSTAKKETAPSGPSRVAIIRHKVADFAKWLPGYEAHDSARLASGLHNYVICRGLEDSNNVMVALKMDDADKAKAMTSSPDMKAAMQKAGVIGAPMIDFTETVMNDTTAIQQTIRVMIRHKVKDWDAWKKVFDEHKQARVDAGLTDRVLGHTVGDNHQVTIVLAVADMEKAKAFMNSKDLKDRMQAGGVDGPPDVYFYRVAKKY